MNDISNTNDSNFYCKCKCCTYWRRHVHRVAANRNRETSKEIAKNKALAKEKAELSWSFRETCQKLLDSRGTIDFLKKENMKLKNKTILDKLLEKFL